MIDLTKPLVIVMNGNKEIAALPRNMRGIRYLDIWKDGRIAATYSRLASGEHYCQIDRTRISVKSAGEALAAFASLVPLQMVYDKIDPESGEVVAPPAYKLTDAQAETIYEIHTVMGFGSSGLFVPEEVFPARDNRDNGGRRTITNLVKKGLIRKVPCPFPLGPTDRVLFENGEPYRMRLTYEALVAFEEYAQRCEYQFPWR